MSLLWLLLSEILTTWVEYRLETQVGMYKCSQFINAINSLSVDSKDNFHLNSENNNQQQSLSGVYSPGKLHSIPALMSTIASILNRCMLNFDKRQSVPLSRSLKYMFVTLGLEFRSG